MKAELTPMITNYLRTLVCWAKDKPPSSNYHLVIEHLGPIVLGIKPSELLNVSLYDQRIWEEFKTLFSQQEQLRLREIRQINGRQQVIFYHRATLDTVLREKHHQEFLRTFNYPEIYSLNCYLNHVLGKIKSKAFPHEIGIFLGYPLKDVLGFMKQIPLTYVGTHGWRIYGDMQVSGEIYEKYQQARTSRVISDI
ncbi:DUF3793 family protein [Desulfosporosinus sp. OT]|uniref:DUF3793 family protein n=1 Tax=Desulfosporosinus sp. OT TaxID=913865 RepID=UPI0002239CC6|nr:DUF3793 family protein [Desulfosporosinus sp. OT]EGW39545.1 hypothetical protein DOT_2598 [Desulfosporosinus sp. OT]